MIWIAALTAMFVWWFATGAILLAVRHADRKGGNAHRLALVKAVPLLFVGIGCVGLSLDTASVGAVYFGFFGALAIWGWIELAFLTGIVTGPMRDVAVPDLPVGERFSRAFQTVAYHELLLVTGLFGLVMLSSGATNRMALATYMVLFLARIGAKLNLYFGVPRINMEFIPAQLAHLKSYFRKGPITLAFPLAITVLTTLTAVCLERLWTAQTDTVTIAFALLSALSALALLEHWLMVIPLPDAKLWRWMLPAPTTTHKKESKTHGL